ncbi:hypothetical protein GCM10010174_65450 [Kutzneria viridogrisea]|uniref:DUF6292 domain-containing protein n=1 Tax=Kutzneria viridogrisea TaxID=47990 RepID=A0ABR6BFJ5_9PSEU|nr:hypothetical protein [Kutzneria viridogrisea]
MTRPRPIAPGDERGRFSRALDEARTAELELQAHAARTVAGHAVDAQDCGTLLSMLGLSADSRTPGWSRSTDSTPALSRGLSGYLHAVAAATGVPEEGTSFEVSDTATAYLALPQHSLLRPGRDLMLVWSEHSGWSVSVETGPTEVPVVVAFLGADAVPDPQLVAQFVAEVLAGSRGPGSPVRSGDRQALAARLARYTRPNRLGS